MLRYNCKELLAIYLAGRSGKPQKMLGSQRCEKIQHDNSFWKLKTILTYQDILTKYVRVSRIILVTSFLDHSQKLYAELQLLAPFHSVGNHFYDVQFVEQTKSPRQVSSKFHSFRFLVNNHTCGFSLFCLWLFNLTQSCFFFHIYFISSKFRI